MGGRGARPPFFPRFPLVALLVVFLSLLVLALKQLFQFSALVSETALLSETAVSVWALGGVRCAVCGWLVGCGL